MNINKLQKTYPAWYSKIRRVWANLFRHRRGTLIFVDPMAIIMLLLFIISVSTSTYCPFIIGWLFVGVSFLYFRFFPLSWVEMTEDEKIAYRIMFQLPDDWSPNKM